MKIVCLEGCSGTGKTTQYHLLNEYFFKSNLKHLSVVEKNYEPFKTAVNDWYKNKGPTINLTLEDIAYFAKSRAESFMKNFNEKDYDLLILDRYFYTSAVYQSNDDISPEEILSINKNYGSPIPDKTFLFDCDSEIAFNRAHERNKITGGKHLFSTGPDKIQKLRSKYFEILEYCPEIEFINTNRSIEEINKEIVSRINLFFK